MSDHVVWPSQHGMVKRKSKSQLVVRNFVHKIFALKLHFSILGFGLMTTWMHASIPKRNGEIIEKMGETGESVKRILGPVGEKNKSLKSQSQMTWTMMENLVTGTSI